MAQKPIAVHLEPNERMRAFCAKTLNGMGFSYRSRQTDISQDMQILIVNSSNLKYVKETRDAGYKGKIVLLTADTSIPYSTYQSIGVDEIAHKPISGTELSQIIKKHTSKQYHILSVEDHADSQSFLENTINMFGHEPVLAKNAEQALKHVPGVHMVISDINQDDSMGGYGLLRKVRERYDGGQLPVVLTSCSDIDRSKSRGAQAILQKPIDVRYLRTIVKMFVPKQYSSQEN